MTYKENSNVFLNYSKIPCPYLIVDSSIDLPTDIRSCISYYVPRIFTSPGNITSSEEISTDSTIHTIIYKDEYLYWSNSEGVSRISLHLGGNIQRIFEEYFDDYVDNNMYDYSISLIEDGRIQQVMALYECSKAPWEFTTDWFKELQIRSFDNNEIKTIAVLPEYDNEEDWNDIYTYFFIITPNNKRVAVSGYRYEWVPDANSLFHFFVRIYDIETAEQLLFYEAEPIEEGYWFQYPICPPVIIGNKVYFEYHFNCDEESADGNWYPNNTPVILEADTENLTVRVARPTIYNNGYTRYIAKLYQCAYDSSLNKLVFLYERFNWHEYLGDNAHYGIMYMNLNDFSVTVGWESEYNSDPYINSHDYPISLLVGPNNTVYMVKEDGRVYRVNDLNTVITTLPMDYYPNGWQKNQSAEEAQQNKICNIVDENGYIWITSGCSLRAYSVSGSPTINTGIRVPYTITYSNSYQGIYLTNGKLFIKNKSINDVDFHPYIQKVV